MNLPIIEKIKLKISPASLFSYFKDSPYSFFLDSALSTNKLGRFSFLGIEPFLIFKSKKHNIELKWAEKKEILSKNPFLVLKDLFKRFKIDTDIDFPFPFIGGGVGYFSYDMKDLIERLPDKAKDDLNLPDSCVCFYDTILVFDHSNNDFFIVSTGFPEKGKKGLLRQKNRLEALKSKIYEKHKLPPQNKIDILKKKHKINLKSNFIKDSYVKAVQKAKTYIKKGDIYQVNLSQRFSVDLNTDPFYLHEILRTINPAPFSCFLNLGDIKIISASPERFLKKKDRFIETRPIKGTRPRGKNENEDIKLKSELNKSAKDRAENLMIIDLERNDLGRICEYGSVRVKEFMECEEYATVFHLVSAVEGKLRNEVDAIDCLMNCFPGGSITGAPKIRSMEIIEELEPVKRSIYTGAIGYIGFDGDMDTSVVIRTLLIKGNTAYFHAGGGIVYDSDPDKEYNETLDKAKALIDSIELSESITEQKTCENSIS